MQAAFWALVLAALAAAFAWCILPFGLRRLAERRLAARARATRTIVLSYDDGPDPALTPRVMEVLAAYDAPATFFVIGEKAERDPEIVATLKAAGHEIGSHTQTHLNAWKVAPGRFAADRDQGAAVVTRLGGQGDLFRPPFGKMTLFGLLRSPKALGWWTVDSQDTFAPRAEAEIIDQIRAAGGGVVLMHDRARPPRLDGEQADAHGTYVEGLTRSILDFAQANDFRVRPLSSLLSGPEAA